MAFINFLSYLLLVYLLAYCIHFKFDRNASVQYIFFLSLNCRHTAIYLILGAILKSKGVSNFQFKWVQFNDRFDCVAGISDDDKPIALGVFVSTRTVLTSANPTETYFNTKKTDSVKVHTISNSYNESTTRDVDLLHGNQSFRDKYWIVMGDKGSKHSCIHDILVITLLKKQRILPRSTNMRSISDRRRPFPVKLPLAIATLFKPGGWVFAGFGYIDKNHVIENTELEVSYYDDSSLTDCDEWIPREWGRFICLLNIDNLAGVASGSPLFHSSDMITVVGIGCFELTKGQESVLIFTDLRPYVDKLNGYIKDEE